MPFLLILVHVLNLLDQEPDLLQVKLSTLISEIEYIAYIWLPGYATFDLNMILKDVHVT